MLIEAIAPLVKKTFQLVGWDLRKLVHSFPDISDEDMDIITYASPYSMTTVERLYALIEATKYIEKHNIKGDIVECGVWRGGNAIAAKLVFENLNSDKKVWLDTMLNEELNLNLEIVGHPIKSALRMFGAFLVGGILPIIPFFFASGYIPLLIAIGISISTSFTVGAIKSRMANMSMIKGGIEMAGLGTGIALIGYGIGTELVNIGIVNV